MISAVGANRIMLVRALGQEFMIFVNITTINNFRGVKSMSDQLPKSIGQLNSMLYRYWNIYLNEQLKPFQLSAGQYQFLFVLYHQEGISQDEVASILRIDKGTTARAIAKLEAEGYVKREVDMMDKRAKKLYLTERAHQFEKQLKAILNQWKAILTNDLTEEEQQHAFDLLGKIAKNAERYIEQREN